MYMGLVVKLLLEINKCMYVLMYIMAKNREKHPGCGETQTFREALFVVFQ